MEETDINHKNTYPAPNQLCQQLGANIRKLRQKIGDEKIVTVKGVGYKYEP